MSVRYRRSDDVEADALRFGEQRNEDQRGENRALHEDGKGQGTTLHAALTRELFGIAVDQACG
jgi:hypothetical protein